MNTQTRVQRLQAGQALALPRRGAGPLVLAEGELLVQAPARCLAGTVVLSAPVRLTAPAVLPAEPGCSIVAVRSSSVVVQEAAPLLSFSRLLAAAPWLRRPAGATRRRRPGGSGPGPGGASVAPASTQP